MTPTQLFARVTCWGFPETSTIGQVKFPDIVKLERDDRTKPCKMRGSAHRQVCFASRLLLLALSLELAGCHRGTSRDVEAKILFTQVPQSTPGDKNEQDVIEGTVSGTQSGQRLVIYSRTGGLWWLQPLLSSPFTTILPDGVWRNETHLGTDYAVLLIDSSYVSAANEMTTVSECRESCDKPVSSHASDRVGRQAPQPCWKFDRPLADRSDEECRDCDKRKVPDLHASAKKS